MPTQKSMDLGLFEIKETDVVHPDGHVSISKTPKVTGKGQIYFVNKFKSAKQLIRKLKLNRTNFYKHKYLYGGVYMKYDAEYRIGKTRVFIVSPENEARLGRKMTEEEKQIILDDISEKASRMAYSIATKKQTSI